MKLSSNNRFFNLMSYNNEKLPWILILSGSAILTLRLIIALFSISINNFSLIKSDWWFLLLGFLSIGVYLVSKDSLITTLFAITADFLLGIPTLQKAFKFPSLEKSKAWVFGAFSSVLAISICFGDPIVYWLFPIYLFLYNLTMIILSNRKESIQS